MAKPLRGPGPRRSSRATKALPPAPAPKVPTSRSRHEAALALYEQAIRRLQRHNFVKAAELLGHVTASYPEERDLIERSRLYLALCARHLTPPAAEPQDNRERLYAATLALNSGKPDLAIAYLNRVRTDEPSNDQALYLLAVSHAERREPELAIGYLRQAIEANPKNRVRARADSDLDSLRGAAGLIALLGSS